MKWITRHKALAIILSVLVLIAILFVASWQLQGDEGAVGRAARTVVAFAQRPIAALTKQAGEGIGAVFSDQALYAENRALREHIDALNEELARTRLNQDELAKLKELEELFRSSDSLGEKELLAANVLSFENSNAFNIFTIDIGTESGVDRNSVVLSGDGLVGRVLSTGNGWAKVVSIIDENNKIGFEVREGEKPYQGVCQGVGDGMLSGNLLDEEGFASEGDLVYTSGLGGIYPAGLVIGVVTKAEFTKDSTLMTIEIEPSAYFKGLRKVLVVP